jgi:hypothetical protein
MVGRADDVPRLRLALDQEEVEDDVESVTRFGRARERVKLNRPLTRPFGTSSSRLHRT